MKSLHQLSRLKQRWQKARVKNQGRREKAINSIDGEIARRQAAPVRSALPKKKQRQLGLLAQIIAFCFRNGQIGFGQQVPEGAIEIARGPEAELRKIIEVIARYSYPSKPGAGDEVQLVPGIPEAQDENAALDALSKFREALKLRLNSH